MANGFEVSHQELQTMANRFMVDLNTVGEGAAGIKEDLRRNRPAGHDQQLADKVLKNVPRSVRLELPGLVRPEDRQP
ncbi:hypothetical protein [Actinoallomurus sp. CA-142502]|uniref:hypothetical protein n=1 Tax=Actinoallomurus sp. CA-142502 TaxID=3239885 RepID=UPI003D8BCF48